MRRAILFSAVALGLALVSLPPACVSDGGGAVGTPTPSTGSETRHPSEPPSGTPQVVVLQEGNDRPTTAIRTKALAELTDNWIGDMMQLDRRRAGCPPPRKDWQFTHVADMGLTWVRLSLDPGEWERIKRPGQYSRYSIDPCQDAIVSELAKNGITIVLTIVYWDEDLHARRPPDYGNEREVERYLDYARMIVRHLKDRVRYYEILNEAIAFVDLRDYLNLLRRVVPVIHGEYPQAKIVTNATSDILAPPDRRYLFGLFRSDVMPSIGAIATNPMFGTSPEYEASRQRYERYPSLARRIKEVAQAHGFTGDYLSEAMIWRTSENALPSEPLTYTEIEASKYFLRAIVMHRGLGFWAGIGGRMYDTIPSFVQAAPRLSTIMDGAEPVNLAVQIESEAADIASYGFSLPNGDRLFALWTDGAAVDHDPGVAATFTFSGQAAEGAVGIDVLEGFQQELITQHMGGGLVIGNLLVKDYPIFVRLTASVS